MIKEKKIANRIPFFKDDKLWVSIGLYGAFFLTVFFPLIIVLLWSFINPEHGWFSPDILPASLSLYHWKQMISDDGILGSIMLSLVISTLVTLFSACIGLPTAYALAKFPFKLKRFFEIFILSPLIIPGIVVATSIGELYFRFNLAFSVPGVILVQMIGTLPFSIRILVANIEMIPQDLIYAARTLGANSVRVAWNVVIPLSIPGFLASGLLNFVNSFQEFDKTFIVGAPAIQTLPVKLFTYISGDMGIIFSLAAVVSFIILVPIITIFIISGRIMRDDIMASGMGKM